MATESVYVFGLGAIGSNILVQLARVYQELSFVGIDFDKVEDRNMRTQAYFLEHMNVPKAQAMAMVLARSNRRAKYKAMNQKITAPIPIPKNSLVLDCFDNVDAREITRKLVCKDILHVGFSPEFVAEVIWEPEYTVPGPIKSEIDICTLNAAGPFIQHICSFASMQVIEFIDNGKKNSAVYGAGRWKKL